MRYWSFVAWCAVIGLAAAQGPPRPRFNGLPQGFRVQEDDLSEDIDRNTVTPSLIPRPQYRQEAPQRGGRPQDFQQSRRGPPPKPGLKEEEEEEEKEEPDRLSQLLPNSKFTCDGKNTGYYADEGLNCEVFHYCQDNSKHSWVCPEGFLFHQVHLICMPPSGESICTQSSQYHFVNDFLYKPLNAEEVHNNANITLRYSDRYYPENFYEEEIAAPVATPKPRHPPQYHQQSQFLSRPQQQQQQPQHPSQFLQANRPLPLRQPNQVFHSPEEVNIPLQQRRPGPSNPHRSISSDDFEYK